MEQKETDDRDRGLEPGVWYVNGVPHSNIKSPHELCLRQKAYNAWRTRSSGENFTKPLKILVEVQCVNPQCPNQGVPYQSLDLSLLLPPKELQSLDSRGPIVGPCVVCHQHTTMPTNTSKVSGVQNG